MRCCVRCWCSSHWGKAGGQWGPGWEPPGCSAFCPMRIPNGYTNRGIASGATAPVLTQQTAFLTRKMPSSRGRRHEGQNLISADNREAGFAKGSKAFSFHSWNEA